MLFKTAWPMDSELQALKLRARTIAGIAGRRIGLVASGVGECDLAAGPEFAASVARDGGFPFLAANLVDKDGKKPFASHMLVEIGGVRVGLFGICNTLTGNIPGQKGLVQRDPTATAKEEVAFLRPKSHLVICLSHHGLQADQELARKVPGIDVIVGGHSREMTTEPIVVNRTLIVQAYCQGKYTGRLDLDAPAVWKPNDAWVSTKYASGGLAGAEAPRFDCLFAPMDKNTGEDGAVVADLKKYNEEAAKLLVPPPASPGQPSVPAVGPPGSSPSVPAPAPAAQPTTRSFVYWGEALCSSCHKEQAAFWKKTPHATAIDVLRRRSRVMDVQCIGCHTTGFKRPGGFDVAAKMFGYENVQCEACHGPGEGHGKANMAQLARTETTCKVCHQKDHSPQFDFVAMLPLMSCPKMQPTTK